MGRLAASLIESWLDDLAAGDIYGALFFDNPHATSPLTVEVAGGSYERAQFDPIDRPAFNIVRNGNLLVWRNLPVGTHIAWVGGFQSPTGGDFVGADSLASPVDLPSGGTWSLDVNELQFGIDAILGP